MTGTQGRRMSTVTERFAGADSMPEIPVPRGDRIEDIDRKQQLVASLLESVECDALLLLEPENIAWFTSGGDFRRSLTGDMRGAVFVTADARVVVTDNVDSVLLFDEVVPELGFQLKERPWQQNRAHLLADLCRGRRVACDRRLPRGIEVTRELQELRVVLTPLDRERMRVLGRLVVHAVEATARHARPGITECETAGELAHRLIKRQVRPVEIQVCGDGINERYRRWGASERVLEQTVVCAATGSRWGLCVSAARTVCFDGIPPGLASNYNDALLILATGMYFSQANWQLAEVWRRVERIYEKFGHQHEWMLADQGAVIANHAREMLTGPDAKLTLVPGMALCWSPSVGPAMLRETVLTTASAADWLTREEAWPTRQVEVKGRALSCPSILDLAATSPS